MAATKIQKLPPEARQLIFAGFQEGKIGRVVYAELLDLFGQEVEFSQRTVERELENLKRRWKQRERRREWMADLVAASEKGNIEASQMVKALAMQGLENDPESFIESDPIKVQALALEGEKIRLKRAKLEQDNQRLALDREKFEGLKTKLATIRKQAEAAKEAVNKAGESISPELKRQLLDVYDLTEAEA
jgi:predicted Holliday junction resolvase-like endonuclease